MSQCIQFNQDDLAAFDERPVRVFVKGDVRTLNTIIDVSFNQKVIFTLARDESTRRDTIIRISTGEYTSSAELEVFVKQHFSSIQEDPIYCTWRHHVSIDNMMSYVDAARLKESLNGIGNLHIVSQDGLTWGTYTMRDMRSPYGTLVNRHLSTLDVAVTTGADKLCLFKQQLADGWDNTRLHKHDHILRAYGSCLQACDKVENKIGLFVCTVFFSYQKSVDVMPMDVGVANANVEQMFDPCATAVSMFEINTVSTVCEIGVNIPAWKLYQWINPDGNVPTKYGDKKITCITTENPKLFRMIRQCYTYPDNPKQLYSFTLKTLDV